MNNTFQELFNFTLPSKPLDNDHLELLLYFLECPEMTANDAFKSAENIFTDNKKVSHRKISRRFAKLHKMNLVEKMPGFKSRKNDVKESIPYKLSLHGILYSLLKYPSNLPRRKLVFYLSRNYPENILFTEFLDSLIDREVILYSKDEILFDTVYLYLKNICKELKNITKSCPFNYTADGYILMEILDWPSDKNSSTYESIPFDDSALRIYLKDKFNWKWIEESRIEPNYNQNFVDVYKPNVPDETIRVSINEKENKAVLIMNDEKIDEFVVINNDSLSVNKKTSLKKEDLFLYEFRKKCKWHQYSFRMTITRQRFLTPRYYPNPRYRIRKSIRSITIGGPIK